MDKVNYFWINANPKYWSFLDKEVGHEEPFSLLSEDGNPRQKHKCFLKVKPGDKAIGYETGNVKKIVVLLEIVKGIHYSEQEKGDAISAQIKEFFPNQISLETLKQELSESQIVKNHRGTLCSLTEQEFKKIIEFGFNLSGLRDEEIKQKALTAPKNCDSSITTCTQYNRNKYVIEYAKRRANGNCQLCNNEAPFVDDKGNPYLEAHHINWLSRGGDDSVDNTIALCPNCHRKMHVLDREEDIKILLSKTL